jgi:hypothetical protein
MLQQYLNATSCMQTGMVMKEKYTRYRHSMLCSERPYAVFFFCFVFHSTLLTLLWSLVAWIQLKSVAISFLASRQCLFELFRLV